MSKTCEACQNEARYASYVIRDTFVEFRTSDGAQGSQPYGGTALCLNDSKNTAESKISFLNRVLRIQGDNFEVRDERTKLSKEGQMITSTFRRAFTSDGRYRGNL